MAAAVRGTGRYAPAGGGCRNRGGKRMAPAAGRPAVRARAVQAQACWGGAPPRGGRYHGRLAAGNRAAATGTALAGGVGEAEG